MSGDVTRLLSQTERVCLVSFPRGSSVLGHVDRRRVSDGLLFVDGMLG